MKTVKWGKRRGMCAEKPKNTVATGDERVTLIPYGATILRMTGDAGSDRKDERTIEITGSVPHKRYESKSPGRQEKLFGRFSKRRKADENTA